MAEHAEGPGGSTTNFEPFIPATQSLPEITVKAVVLGFILSAVLAGANAYLGLKVGLTVSASIPAAVISMAILRMFRESNILENNIVQTSASAGESLAAGVIFTIPALILLGFWQEFNFLETVSIAAFGGILGVLFTIPLRRALIIEQPLKFPEGVATGEVLKAGTKGGEGVKAIAWAAAGSALLKLGQTGLKIFAGSAHAATRAGNAVFGIGTDLSVALLGVGYIVGLNIAILVFAGGLISWLFGIPIYSAITDPALLPQGETAFEVADEIWSSQIRYLGVGAMATGGMWALISLIGPIRHGVSRSLEAVRASRSGEQVEIPRTDRDTPINIVLTSAALLSLPLIGVFLFVLDADVLGISSGLYWTVVLFGVIFSLVAGFLFASVAGYMAGLVGSSNNPISGVTIATILTASLILLVMLGSQIDFEAGEAGRATAAAAAAILIGAVVCCAAAIAGDNMQDLKAGQIVGATPYKQQIMQVVGVVAAALVIAPILELLLQAYGLGGFLPRADMDPGEMLEAPQATLMASVAEGVFSRNLPWTMIFIGSVVAVAIIVLDEILKKRGSTFRTPVLAVAVGIYLPIELSVPIFIGGVVAFMAGKAARAKNPANPEAAVKASEGKGLLFSSGLITGEALVGILLAIPFAAAQSTDVLAIPGFDGISYGLGIAAFVAFIIWLYKTSSSVKV
jgi:putative OPT family oligopeptide transporter